MTKVKSIYGVALIITILTCCAYAQQTSPASTSGIIPDGKVVVVNTSIFPEKIGELKQKYDLVNNKFKDAAKELQDINSAVQKLQQEIERGAGTLSPEVLQQKKDQLDDLKRQGTRKLEDYDQARQKEIDTQTMPIRQKLSNFVENYAKQRGIVLMIELSGAAQTGSLAYVNPSTDITEDFIKEYNKANPVPGPPAAAQPAPTSPRSGGGK